MKENWEKIKLGDVCSKIGSGATPKGGSGVYVEEGTSFIRSQNVYNLHFSYEGLAFINDDAAQKLKGVTVKEYDVLLNITGDSVARTCIVPKNVIPARVNQHVAIIRVFQDRINPFFLNYYLASPFMQSYMLGLAVGKGTSRNAMTKEMIENFTVPCPDLEVQNRIVDVLKEIDLLIENNQKQIKLLEEAAQRLYQEWFVDLRFPGHENVKIVDGVPEGWKKERLIDIAEVQYGFAFDGSLFNNKGLGKPIVRIRNIPDSATNDYTTEEASEKYIVKNGDIVVGMDGEFHINSWSGDDSYLVQRCCCFRPKNDISKGWLFLAINEPIKFYEKTVVGATVAHLSKKNIDSIVVLLPNRKYLNVFEKIYDLRLGYMNKIKRLQEARDRLLPKLMSGEIEV